jgi:hypothetical protein
MEKNLINETPQCGVMVITCATYAETLTFHLELLASV